MKKSAVILILFLMAFMIHAASKIQVDRPVAGEIIYKGEKPWYVIKWTATGPMHSIVKIRLFNKSLTAKIANIANYTKTTINSDTTTGTFRWMKDDINKIAPGEYIIRIKTVDNMFFANSKVFRIKGYKNLQIAKKPVAKKITIKKFPKYFLKPDLTISLAPNINPIGYTSYFNILVRNIGVVDTPPSKWVTVWIHWYYWGPDGKKNPPEKLIGSKAFWNKDGIKKGGKWFRVIERKFWSAGKYTVSVSVNKYKSPAFQESDFSNNEVIKEFWLKKN